MEPQSFPTTPSRYISCLTSYIPVPFFDVTYGNRKTSDFYDTEVIDQIEPASSIASFRPHPCFRRSLLPFLANHTRNPTNKAFLWHRLGLKALLPILCCSVFSPFVSSLNVSYYGGTSPLILAKECTGLVPGFLLFHGSRRRFRPIFSFFPRCFSPSCLFAFPVRFGKARFSLQRFPSLGPPLLKFFMVVMRLTNLTARHTSKENTSPPANGSRVCPPSFDLFPL